MDLLETRYAPLCPFSLVLHSFFYPWLFCFSRLFCFTVVSFSLILLFFSGWWEVAMLTTPILGEPCFSCHAWPQWLQKALPYLHSLHVPAMQGLGPPGWIGVGPHETRLEDPRGSCCSLVKCFLTLIHLCGACIKISAPCLPL